MTCQHCGTQCPEGTSVCPHCGAALAQQTYQQQQPVYQQPYDATKEVMSVGSYIGVFILSVIPIVNIICWIVWLVSPNTNRNKKNYIIANIVLFIIAIVASVILSLAGAAFGIKFFS